jgi:hypothetical protein
MLRYVHGFYVWGDRIGVIGVGYARLEERNECEAVAPVDIYGCKVVEAAAREPLPTNERSLCERDAVVVQKVDNAVRELGGEARWSSGDGEAH